MQLLNAKVRAPEGRLSPRLAFRARVQLTTTLSRPPLTTIPYRLPSLMTFSIRPRVTSAKLMPLRPSDVRTRRTAASAAPCTSRSVLLAPRMARSATSAPRPPSMASPNSALRASRIVRNGPAPCRLTPGGRVIPPSNVPAGKAIVSPGWAVATASVNVFARTGTGSGRVVDDEAFGRLAQPAIASEAPIMRSEALRRTGRHGREYASMGRLVWSRAKEPNENHLTSRGAFHAPLRAGESGRRVS